MNNYHDTGEKLFGLPVVIDDTMPCSTEPAVAYYMTDLFPAPKYRLRRPTDEEKRAIEAMGYKCEWILA